MRQTRIPLYTTSALEPRALVNEQNGQKNVLRNYFYRECYLFMTSINISFPKNKHICSIDEGPRINATKMAVALIFRVRKTIYFYSLGR